MLIANFKETPYICICIGSNKVNGDLLGPLVGTYLKRKILYAHNIEVYGDVVNPVTFNNINYVFNKVNHKYNKYCAILIDSALGKNVGKIVINSGNIIVGESIKNGKEISGNIVIKGIVGKNYNNNYKNLLELQKTKFSEVNKLALQISNIII